MKKILFSFIASFSAYAATPTIYMAPPNSKVALEGKQEGAKEHAPSNPLSEVAKTAASKALSTKEPGEMMIISPEARAKDIEAAIRFFRQYAPADKPKIKLKNGETISGITEIHVMPGGTLLIFRYTSLKGLKYKVENIENIEKISISET